MAAYKLNYLVAKILFPVKPLITAYFPFRHQLSKQQQQVSSHLHLPAFPLPLPRACSGKDIVLDSRRHWLLFRDNRRNGVFP